MDVDTVSHDGWLTYPDVCHFILNQPPRPHTRRPPSLLNLAVIFPQHVENGRQDNTVTLLTGFRNYLHYHLKATKTYMHMRMRKRVVGLLQGKSTFCSLLLAFALHTHIHATMFCFDRVPRPPLTTVFVVCSDPPFVHGSLCWWYPSRVLALCSLRSEHYCSCLLDATGAVGWTVIVSHSLARGRTRMPTACGVGK